MFKSKYGVARTIYLPVIKRAVVDFAVGADWIPAAGDVKISKDGGVAANVTTLPTAIAMGNGAIWSFPLSATEMQAAQVVVTVVDAATKAVEDQSFIIETYGNAAAQFLFDISTATPTVIASTVSDKTGYTVSTVSDKTGYALTSTYDFANGTTAMTESYAANAAAPTPAQALFAIHQMLMQFSISGASYTVRKLDNSTTAFVVALNNATVPTSAGRT